MYQGFDINIEGRFRNGAFLKGGIGAPSRTFDNCNLLAAGLDAVAAARRANAAGHRDLSRMARQRAIASIPYRPDAKISGAYTLPFDIHPRRHVSVQPRRADRRRGSEHPGELGDRERGRPTALGRNWTGAASRTIQLIREGLSTAITI